MKKEKQIKTHQRRTKGGKTVIVRAHKAKYDAAEELKKSLTKKKGAGDELESRKSKVEDVSPDLGFTDAEYKEWYHWDQEGDPKNKTALKVEKALIAKMGKRAYNKYFNDLSDSYSARGHSKAYKSLVAEHTETPTPKTPKTPKADSTSKAKDTSKINWSEVETPKKDVVRAAKALGITEKEALSWMEGPNFSGFKEKDLRKADKAAEKFLGKEVYSKLDPSSSEIPMAVLDKLSGKSKKASVDNPVEKTVMYKGMKVKALDFGSLSAKEEEALSKRLTPMPLKDVMGVKLPRANKFGESSIALSAKQRNAIIERAIQSGWKVEDSRESSSTTWKLLSNGEYTISIHTGKDKFFNDVVITKPQQMFTAKLDPQPKEKTSWGHTSREKGKAVRPLDMRGQANYSGITSSGLKLPKKFTYDSDTRSDWYDSFRTKDSASIENVVSQAKKAKWQKGGSGKMVRYTSPDGRVHILVNKGDKSASVFYR